MGSPGAAKTLMFNDRYLHETGLTCERLSLQIFSDPRGIQ